MDAVVLEQVTKRFDSVVAVSDLSLRIKQSAIFGLLGPNGAGKTTTLRMMMRVMIPDEGTVNVLGEPLSDRTQDLIGYLPERSEEHTSELQSPCNLVCRLLLEKKKKKIVPTSSKNVTAITYVMVKMF